MQDSYLSKALCLAHEREHCVLVGSATIGLVLALRTAGVQGKHVAVPNNVCLNVPLAVIYAGGIPIYCDIDPATLGLSVDSLRRSVPRPAAAIAVHAYGSVCNIEQIAEYCRNNKIFLVEDLAMAQGATFRGRPVGRFGDCAVLSFGSGKIIDAGGGGALLTNDQSFASAINLLHEELPVRTEEDARRLGEFSRYHTWFYNEHYNVDLESHAPSFLDTATNLKPTFLSRPRWNMDGVTARLEILTKNIRRREHFAHKLYEEFSDLDDNLTTHRPPEGSVYWRFNVFIHSDRNRVLKALLSEKFHVSSWFPSSDIFLGGRRLSCAVTPVSDLVSDEILNIWVNHQVDENYVREIGARIRQLLRPR